MKKFIKITVCALIITILVGALTACSSPNDKKYFEKVSAYSFWDNTAAQSIAQYKFYDIMNTFLEEGTITDGNSVDKDGKTRKVLFLGWDGTRADAMANVFFDSNNPIDSNYNYQIDNYSGLQRLKDQGGLYMAYAGGEHKKDSEQSSSTCAGWTSELTGGWNTKHGVKTNDDIKNADADTLMMKFAKQGLSTGLAFDWGQLFDTTLQNDVKYLLDNPSTPMLLRDINRTKATSNADIMRNENLKKEKQIRAKNLDYYNAVAMDNVGALAKYDIGMRDYLLDRITNGDDIVGGIFHNPDSNGHTTGFSNDNGNYVNSIRSADNYLYQLLLAIEAREADLNEEWLVIVTTDHGGSGRDHGMQVYEHRTTWVATNKEIDSKYYGNNYDGMRELG